jgi:hypothetical protein
MHRMLCETRASSWLPIEWNAADERPDGHTIASRPLLPRLHALDDLKNRLRAATWGRSGPALSSRHSLGWHADCSLRGDMFEIRGGMHHAT